MKTSPFITTVIAQLCLAASLTALADPGITNFSITPVTGGVDIVISATNDIGRNAQFSFLASNDVTHAVYFVDYTLAPDGLPEKAALAFAPSASQLPGSNLLTFTWSPETQLVAFEDADKTTYLSDTNAHPEGFGSYQHNGPEYSYLVSKFEVSNKDFCNFLNDAQNNPGNQRGANLVFATNGYVFFNSAALSQTPPTAFDIFHIFRNAGRISYNSTNTVGERYDVVSGMEDHPVISVSWYGAMKYCNWLSIENGIDLDFLAYTEGENPTDWHPKTAGGWPFFGDSDRADWINFHGFRLPMLHNSTGSPSAYNEHYKASAWNGSNHTAFGFGRDSIDQQDANYLSSGDPFGGNFNATTPIGYYDGTLQGGSFQTRSNGNFYGIYDLSGNVAEWLTDRITNDAARTAIQGGSYVNASGSLNLGTQTYTIPETTLWFVGFRVMRTLKGTNAIPLIIAPATNAFAFADDVLRVQFTAIGGTGTYSWSISNPSFGFLTTTSGPAVSYVATNIPTGLFVTQLVSVADGSTALTSSVFQAFQTTPPPPPGRLIPTTRIFRSYMIRPVPAQPRLRLTRVDHFFEVTQGRFDASLIHEQAGSNQCRMKTQVTNDGNVLRGHPALRNFDGGWMGVANRFKIFDVRGEVTRFARGPSLFGGFVVGGTCPKVPAVDANDVNGVRCLFNMFFGIAFQ